VQETIQYVTYYVAPQPKGGLRPIFSQYEDKGVLGSLQQQTPYSPIQIEPLQYQSVQEFINTRNPGAKVAEIFVETPDSRRTAKWPQLQKAVDACKRRNATLLIAELGNLTNNETFTHHLLGSGIKFHCLDQPFVNQTILEALSKHAQVQRKLHGKLIRQGLKLTSAKSGNPNAAEVISKVNKPKIDTAIVFAFLLQLIIQDYRRKGYSQRQMVKTLNDEGFTAPEGGKWVLSQLQKVLDRVRLNEIATEVQPLLEALVLDGKTPAEIAEALNAKAIPALKKGLWDEAQVKKLDDRIKQIQEIVLINRFVLNLLPVLHEYCRQGLTPVEMLQECYKAGIPLRQDVGASAAA
jgi:DNA invertase Pin-like site-specific DNA recombinase